jgi:F0F1-type ATP synthase assembly protein I
MEKAKKKPHRPVAASANKKQTQFEQAMYQRNLFLSMALNMTWQLALVVLIPIVGGFKLDQHFNSSPAFTLIGVVVTILGVVVVLRQVVAAANQRTNNTEVNKK